MVFNKKAISPVVATALLLVVAVVAVVGFQTWFNTYQSGLNTKVEQQSNTGTAITVERLELSGTDCIVYLKNSGTEDINASSVKVGSVTNSSTSTITKSTITEVNVASCGVTKGSSADVVVVTSDGVFSETEIVR